MSEGQACAVWGIVRELEFDPAYISGEFPCDGDVRLRFALGDGAVCVGFDLVAAVQLEIAGNVGGPAGNAIGVGDSTPEVIHGGVEGAG